MKDKTNSLNNNFFKTYLIQFLLSIVFMLTLIFFIFSYTITNKIINERSFLMNNVQNNVYTEIQQMNIIASEVSKDKSFSPYFKNDEPGYFYDIKKYISSVKARQHIFKELYFYDILEQRIYSSDGKYKDDEVIDILEMRRIKEELDGDGYSFWIKGLREVYYVYPISTDFKNQKNLTCLIFAIPTKKIDTLIEDALLGISGSSMIYYNNEIIYTYNEEKHSGHNYKLKVFSKDFLKMEVSLNQLDVFRSLWPLFLGMLLFFIFFIIMGVAILFLVMNKFALPLSNVLSRVLAISSKDLTISNIGLKLGKLVSENSQYQNLKTQIEYDGFMFNLLSSQFIKEEDFDDRCEKYNFVAKETNYLCISTWCVENGLELILVFLKSQDTTYHFVNGNINRYYFILEGTLESLEKLKRNIPLYGWNSNNELYIGTGDIVKELKKINLSYTTSRYHLDQAIEQKTPIYKCPNMAADNQGQNIMSFIWDDIKQIDLVLEQREMGQFLFISDSLKDAITLCGSLYFCLSLYTTYVHTVFSFLQQKDFLDKPISYILDEYLDLSTYSANMFLENIEKVKNMVVDVLDNTESVGNTILLDEIIAFIHDNYTDPDFSIKKMAMELDFSISYISNYFKTNYGFTLTQYIDKLRMNTVKKLLSSGEMTIQEITTHVGYANSSTLIRCFKKVEGMTPGEYRKRLK